MGSNFLKDIMPLFSVGKKRYFIYIITNNSRTVLYIGLCNNLKRRMREHKRQMGNKKTFAGRYYCNVLLYYEEFGEVMAAISREKEIKGWKRHKKEALIASKNPKWEDLSFDILDI
ncbi:MAG: GIY-YIG nuclease family protein [Bacteroidota bacterium]